MILDARYIFVYENLPYLSPTPMEKDKEYLEKEHGGYFEKIDHSTLYWDKPKYLLTQDDFDKLLADQILERKDCELWRIIRIPFPF